MVRAMEELFKRYLIVCEYMQIDPCTVYDAGYIEERAVHILSQWDNGDAATADMLAKELRWFAKEYGRLAGKGFMKRDFAYRCSLFIKKKYLSIYPGTVSKEYRKKELRHINYDSYRNATNRPR